MTPPVNPETSIGPYWRALGAFVAVGTIAFLLAAVFKGIPLGWVVAVIVGALLITVLALVRPAWAESAFKALVAKIPFTKYDGDQG